MSSDFTAFKLPEGYRISDLTEDILDPFGENKLPPIAPYEEIEKVLLKQPWFFKSPYWVPQIEGIRTEEILYIEGLDLNCIPLGSEPYKDPMWQHKLHWAIDLALVQGLITSYIEFDLNGDPVLWIDQHRGRREDFRKVLDPLAQYGPFVVYDFQTGTFHAASDL